jgi:hypothetical protein
MQVYQYVQIPSPKQGEIVRQVAFSQRAKLHHVGMLLSIEMGKNPLSNWGGKHTMMLLLLVISPSLHANMAAMDYETYDYLAMLLRPRYTLGLLHCKDDRLKKH